MNGYCIHIYDMDQTLTRVPPPPPPVLRPCCTTMASGDTQALSELCLQSLNSLNSEK